MTEERWEEMGESIKESVEILLEDEKGISSSKRGWLAEKMKMVFVESYEDLVN